ncbi:unnamed protein product [Choristocarpus tenellus]
MVRVTPQLKGLPWLMHDWFYLSLLGGVALIVAVELTLCGFLHVFFFVNFDGSGHRSSNAGVENRRTRPPARAHSRAPRSMGGQPSLQQNRQAGMLGGGAVNVDTSQEETTNAPESGDSNNGSDNWPRGNSSGSRNTQEGESLMGGGEPSALSPSFSSGMSPSPSVGITRGWIQRSQVESLDRHGRGMEWTSLRRRTIQSPGERNNLHGVGVALPGLGGNDASWRRGSGVHIEESGGSAVGRGGYRGGGGRGRARGGISSDGDDVIANLDEVIDNVVGRMSQQEDSLWQLSSRPSRSSEVSMQEEAKGVEQ